MRGTSTTRRAPRGGRGGYEPRIVIRAREYQVWQLRVRGRTQRQIAIEVGVTQVAVCRILQRIEDRSLATLHRERVRYLIQHYARADHVYAQAQEGWDRSCAERQRRTQRRTNTGKHMAPCSRPRCPW